MARQMISLPNDDPPERRRYWADRIANNWRAALEAIFATGRQLIAAKAELAHGEFEAMTQNDLPFGPRTAQRLMKVASDRRLANTTHGPFLPPSWRTLYELTKLSDESFERAIADGTIHPEVERHEIAAIVSVRDRDLDVDAPWTADQLDDKPLSAPHGLTDDGMGQSARPRSACGPDRIPQLREALRSQSARPREG